ncbi:MAG: NAD-binding protein [Desulfobulbaceae bacterium]|nr:NAD-binding protein [Desulfobulbaceae bacterium]
MRIVFIGTSKIALTSARALIEDGHEIVFVEKDMEKIDQLSDEMDCGFVHGDGSAPDILQEVGPKQTDFLFCMTGNDKDNIIASLVGRSLGYSKTITKIEDFAYEHICTELGLEDVIVPTRTISRYLVDMIKGRDASELSNVIRDKGRFYTFIAGEGEDGKSVEELELPKKAEIICYYRNNDFHLARRESRLKLDDEVVILTHRDVLESLHEKWPTRKSAAINDAGLDDGSDA